MGSLMGPISYSNDNIHTQSKPPQVTPRPLAQGIDNQSLMDSFENLSIQGPGVDQTLNFQRKFLICYICHQNVIYLHNNNKYTHDHHF